MDDDWNSYSHNSERYINRNVMDRGSHQRRHQNWQRRDDEFHRSWNNQPRYPNRFGNGSFYNQDYSNSRRYHDTPWQNGDYRRMLIQNVYKVDNSVERSSVSHDHRGHPLDNYCPSSTIQSLHETPLEGRKKTPGRKKNPGSDRTQVTPDKKKTCKKGSPVSRKGIANSVSHKKSDNLKKKSEKKPSAKVCPSLSLTAKNPARHLKQIRSPRKLLDPANQVENSAKSSSSVINTAKAKPAPERLKHNGKINGALNKSSLLRMISDPRSRRSRYKLAEMMRNHGKGPSKRSVSVANLQLSEMFEESPETTGIIQLEKLPSEIQQEIANLAVNKSPDVYKDISRVKSTAVKSPVNHMDINRVNRTADNRNMNKTANNLTYEHRNRTEGGTSSDEELKRVKRLLSVMGNIKEIKTEKIDLYEGDINQAANGSTCLTTRQIMSRNARNQGFSKSFRCSLKDRPSEKAWLSSELVIKSEPISAVPLCDPRLNDIVLKKKSYKVATDVQSSIPITSTESNITADLHSIEHSLEGGNAGIKSGEVSKECLTVFTSKFNSTTGSSTSVLADATISQHNPNENQNVSRLSSTAQMHDSASSLTQCNQKSISVNSQQNTSSSASIVPETSLPIRLSSDLLTSKKMLTCASVETEKSRWVSKATSTTSAKTANKLTPSSAVITRHGPVLSTTFSTPATHSNYQRLKELLTCDHNASEKNSTQLSAPFITQHSNSVTPEGISLLQLSKSSSQPLQSTLVTEIESASTVQAITMPILLPSTTAGKKRKEQRNKSSARNPASEQANEPSQTKANERKSTELGTMDNVNKVLQLSMREETVRQNVTAINIKLSSVQKSILKYQIQLAVLEQNKAQLVKEEEALRSERMAILQNVVSNAGGSLPILEAECPDTTSWNTGKKRRPRTSSKNTTVNNISEGVNFASTALHNDNPSANSHLNATVTEFERTISNPESSALHANNSEHISQTNRLSLSQQESESVIYACAEQVTQFEAGNIPRREEPRREEPDSGIQVSQSAEVSIPGRDDAIQNSSVVSASNSRKRSAYDPREEINSVAKTSKAVTGAAIVAYTAPESVHTSEVKSQGWLPKKGCVRKRKPRKESNVCPRQSAGAVIVQEKLGISSNQLPGFCMEYIGTLTPGDDEETIISKLASGVIKTQISEVKQALASRQSSGTRLAVSVDNTSAVSLREAEPSTSGFDFSYSSDDPKSNEFFLSCLNQSSGTDELARNEAQPQENILPCTKSYTVPSSQPTQDCFVSLGKRTVDNSDTRKKLRSKGKKQQTDHIKRKSMKVKKGKKKKPKASSSTNKDCYQKTDSFKHDCQNLKVPISNSANMKSDDTSYASNTIVQESRNTIVQVPGDNSVHVTGNTIVQEHCKKLQQDVGLKSVKTVNNRSKVSKSSVQCPDVYVKPLTVDSAEELKKSVTFASAYVFEDTDSLPDIEGVRMPHVVNLADKKRSPSPEKRKKLRTRRERGVKQLYTVDSSSDNPDANSFLLADKISTSPTKPRVSRHSKPSLNDTPDAKKNQVNTRETDNGEIKNECRSSDSDLKCIKSETEQLVDRNENVKVENEILSEDDLPLITLVESSQFKGPDLNVTAIQVYKGLVYVCYSGCVARKFNPETIDKRCIMEYKTIYSIQTEHMVVTNKGQRSNEDKVFLGGSGKTLVSFHEKSGLIDDSYVFGEKIMCLHNRWCHLFIGLANGGVLVFDLKKNKSTGAFRCANKAICSISSSTEGVRKVICVASQDSSISVFDASSGMMLRTLGGHDGFLITLKAFSGFLYSGSSNGKVLVHNINTGELVTVLSRTSGFITCLHPITIDETPYLLTGSYNKFISCYDLQTKSRKQVYYGAGYSFINSMALYHNKIITGNKEGVVEEVVLNPNQDWPCEAEGCSYVFGIQDHRNHHMKEDHYLVPCSWKTCDMWLNNENEQIIADHMTRHLIQS